MKDEKRTIMTYQGAKKLEIHLENNILHRVAAPARIQFKNNRIVSEAYFQNGLRHREDGPALIEYSITGTIKNQEYWLNGHSIKKLKEEG